MAKETKALTLNPQMEAFQANLIEKYSAANETAKRGQTVFVGSSLMEILPPTVVGAVAVGSIWKLFLE